MRIGRFARRTGVSVKAVRYYERIGLISPKRSSNGYREFDENHVRIVEEIRELAAIGIPPSSAGPFIECLNLGHEHGDDCVSSLAVYRDTIADMNRKIASLAFRRDALQQRLDARASSSFGKDDVTFVDYSILPEGLPAPEDDGAADHLPGMAMPSLDLPASDGRVVNLAELGPGRTILYLYPLTGRPGVDLPEGWDTIPGAHGCSTEACNFRNFQDLRRAGAQRVFGMSSQDTGYQAEVVAPPLAPVRHALRRTVHAGRRAATAGVRRERPRPALRPADPGDPRRRHRARLLPNLPAKHPRQPSPRLAQPAPHR